MRELIFRSNASNRDELLSAIWEAGTCGVIEEEHRLRAFFEDNADVLPLTGRVDFDSAANAHEDRPASFSKEDWTGVLAGSRFFIAPPWLCEPTPPGRIRLAVDAGSAFGTGRHETTQLMIAAMEQIIRGGETVLDVGCGSGILSEVARKLGAGAVFGCDIDELAVSAAKDQFNVPVFVGSVDALAAASADVLLVNISARVIDALAPELKRVANTNCHVLLAGFTTDRTPTTFDPVATARFGDWECWIGRRNGFRCEEALHGVPLKHSAQWW